MNVQRLGGADWNRTSDPLLAKQVLSQLSYSPAHKCMIVNFEPPREILTLEAQLVGLDRIELSTPRLSSACSSQLSYRPSRLLSQPKTIIDSRVAPTSRELILIILTLMMLFGTASSVLKR